MVRCNYNSTDADYVIIKFKCNCGKEVTTDLIPVRLRYDNSKDLNSFDHDKPIICESCLKEHKIHFYDNLYYAYCEIITIDDDNSPIQIREIPYEYTIGLDNALPDYAEEIVMLKDFIEKVKKETSLNNALIYRMLLTYSISIMDAYIGNTFRYYIKKHEIFLNQFISWKKLTNKTTNKEKELERLKTQSFQNMKKVVIPYFRYTFGIEIPTNNVIERTVLIRNSIIHNNGRDEDGYKNKVTLGLIEELILEIQKLVNFITLQINDTVVEKIIYENLKKNNAL